MRSRDDSHPPGLTDSRSPDRGPDPDVRRGNQAEPSEPASGVSDRSDDFSSEELAMLRDFFRDEAHEALEQLTAGLLTARDQGLSSAVLNEMMRTTHTLKGSAGTVGLPSVVAIVHTLEDRLARLRDPGTRRRAMQSPADTIDAFVSAIDSLRSYVDAIEQPIERERLWRLMAQQLESLRDAGGEQSGGEGRDHGATAVPVPVGIEHTGDTTRSVVSPEICEGIPRDSAGILRVDASRIDVLMDCVGELIVDRNRIERRANGLGAMAQQLKQLARDLRALPSAAPQSEIDLMWADLERGIDAIARAAAELTTDTKALRRTSASLLNGLTKVRMASAKSLFQALARQLRAIAREAGKKVELVTSGAETEFDKAVVERVTDPLVQLLRNAVAHGIEDEPTRHARGKRPRGEIRIEARAEGSMVVIEVSDDGTGIDPDVLRQRFVATGLWSQTRADLASDEETLQAIFEPGMSTRDAADSLAGRGVGLDAVRATIAALGGEIRLTSTPGIGTRFTIHLPVSASISQAFLFKVDHGVYAVPYVNVVATQTIELAGDHWPDYIGLDGELVPLLSLQDLLQSRSPVEMAVASVVILEYIGKRLALSCDKLVGPREIVVKDPGPLLTPLHLYAGATIGPSGKVQLLLDPATLVRLAYPSRASGARVLVVDDSRTIRESMASVLSDEGCKVETASDGAAAWAMISTSHYDFVITDLEMPRLDGFGLIEKIRASDRLAATPIVIVSSRNDADSRARARGLSVHDFVAKPVTRAQILAIIGSL